MPPLSPSLPSREDESQRVPFEALAGEGSASTPLRRIGSSESREPADESGGFDEEFQVLLREVGADSSLRSRSWAQVGELVADFMAAAETFGKVIISEQRLATQSKSIRPANVGGVAGGVKFIAGNIFFRFPVDHHGLYGGEELSAKEANHQLKGLAAMYNADVDGLCLPLLAVVDYHGFKLVAMSVLPLLGDGSLRYGSSDGGQSVRSPATSVLQLSQHEARPRLQPGSEPRLLRSCSDGSCPEEPSPHSHAHAAQGEALPLEDPECARLVEQAARELNLAPHPVLERQSQVRWVHTPCDMEVHRVRVRSGQEERLYVVDFARLFPPLPPRAVLLEMLRGSSASRALAAHQASGARAHSRPHAQGASHLVYLLRPELVRRWHVPLSPDAFSRFASTRPEHAAFDEAVAEAARSLLLSVVPQFGARLAARDYPLPLDARAAAAAGGRFLRTLGQLGQRVVSDMHVAGINARYLGLVFAACKNANWRRELLLEAVARTVKALARGEMRVAGQGIALRTQRPFVRAVTRLFNRVLGRAPCTRPRRSPGAPGGCANCVDPARACSCRCDPSCPCYGQSTGEPEPDAPRQRHWCERLPALLAERFWFDKAALRPALVALEDARFPEPRCRCCGCLWKRCLPDARLFARLQAACHVELSAPAQEACDVALRDALATAAPKPSPLPQLHGQRFFDRFEPFLLDSGDVLELRASLRVLPIMEYAQGTALLISARKCKAEGQLADSRHLLELAEERLAAGLAISGADARLLLHMGVVLEARGETKRALGSYIAALRANANFARAWLHLAQLLAGQMRDARSQLLPPPPVTTQQQQVQQLHQQQQHQQPLLPPPQQQSLHWQQRESECAKQLLGCLATAGYLWQPVRAALSLFAAAKPGQDKAVASVAQQQLWAALPALYLKPFPADAGQDSNVRPLSDATSAVREFIEGALVVSCRLAPHSAECLRELAQHLSHHHESEACPVARKLALRARAVPLYERSLEIERSPDTLARLGAHLMEDALLLARLDKAGGGPGQATDAAASRGYNTPLDAMRAAEARLAEVVRLQPTSAMHRWTLASCLLYQFREAVVSDPGGCDGAAAPQLVARALAETEQGLQAVERFEAASKERRRGEHAVVRLLDEPGPSHLKACLQACEQLQLLSKLLQFCHLVTTREREMAEAGRKAQLEDVARACLRTAEHVLHNELESLAREKSEQERAPEVQHLWMKLRRLRVDHAVLCLTLADPGFKLDEKISVQVLRHRQQALRQSCEPRTERRDLLDEAERLLKQRDAWPGGTDPLGESTYLQLREFFYGPNRPQYQHKPQR